MVKSHPWRDPLRTDLGILILLALVKLVVHTLTNDRYGFHRDELAMVDNARHLAWGYVAYPPLTPAIARLALDLFGPSLVGLRFFSALSQSIALVLAGLIARELGGGRPAQIMAAVATAIAPISFIMGTMFQYVAFDFMGWVLIAYLVVRLLNSGDPRWWLGIGAAIGLGMMTKYTIAFYVAGIVVGALLTHVRRHLASPWLWGGVALSLLIFLPNLIWQVQHDFISLQFLSSIHERDVRIGRTDEFLLDQLRVASNPLTVPLWIAGLYFYFFSPARRRYRMIGWMAVITFALFWAAQGRGYYLGPIYPMLFAGGAVWGEKWLAARSAGRARLVRATAWSFLALGTVVIIILALPVTPVNSPIWQLASSVNQDLKEQVGWPELVQTVADIYAALPDAEQARTGILTGNYGEAGAINLFGPAHGLPRAISGINSYWLRGYGDPPPDTLIVLGFDQGEVERIFETCELAGHVTNSYGVENEETLYHPDIFLCRGLRQPWPEFWRDFQFFG